MLGRRVLVVGALVALTATLGAGPVAGQDESEEPGGVAVPGLEVAQVSGEATGGEAEETISGDLTMSAGTAKELTTALLSGDTATVSTILASITATGTTGLVTVEGSAGPDPHVKLPATGGGPLGDSEETLDLEYDDGTSFPIAEDLDVETQGATGATGYARSEAAAEHVDAYLGGADKISTECHADLGGVTATTTVDDGGYYDLDGWDGNSEPPIEDIDEHPDVDEELIDFDETFTTTTPNQLVEFEAFLIANEQEEDAHAITVTGLRVEANIKVLDVTNPAAPVVLYIDDIEASFAVSHCDVVPAGQAVVVEPRFTG